MELCLVGIVLNPKCPDFLDLVPKCLKCFMRVRSVLVPKRLVAEVSGNPLFTVNSKLRNIKKLN